MMKHFYKRMSAVLLSCALMLSGSISLAEANDTDIDEETPELIVIEEVADEAFELEDELDEAFENVEAVELGDPVTKIEAGGIFFYKVQTGIKCGMGIDALGDISAVMYKWYTSANDGETWTLLYNWTSKGTITWTPKTPGTYKIKCEARIGTDDSTKVEATGYGEYHPYISGKCQMPYEGEGGGYLIGVSSYTNPSQSYQYEILILDCTLFAEGKDAWVYSSGKCPVEEGTTLWTVWQPQYGYFWTLFRVYNNKGVMIDEACYGFRNDGTGNIDPVEETGRQMVDYAKQFLGTPYVYGGNSLKTGTDCSGFTMLVYKEFGYKTLTHSARAQATLGVKVPLSEIKPGDLLFYTFGSNRIEHVTMYAGDGCIIHSGSDTDGKSKICIRNNYSVPIKAVRIIK